MDALKNSTRILVATPNSGGPATYVKQLSLKLPAFGYDIDVVNFGEVLKYPKIIRHVIYFFYLLKNIRGVDIIYAQDPVSVGLPAIIAAKISGKRFFLKIVGDYAWEQGVQRFGIKDNLDEFVGNDNYSLQVKLLRNIEIFVARNSEKIIVPSNYLKEIVKKWGIAENKIEVVHNAFTKIDILESKEDLRKKFNWDFPVVVSAGRLVPWKKFDILIDSMEVVLKSIKDTKLFIMGDGPEKKKLEEIINYKGLSGSVFLLGHVNHRDLYERIKASDVFSLVSSYEGFSHLLIEALSLGAPVVVTPTGGNMEIIRDGEYGIFVAKGNSVETAEKIIKVIQNKEISEKLSKGALKSVEVFNEKNMLQKLALVLR